MKPPARFEPPESFEDPRTKPGYQSCHWPSCGGKEGPGIGALDLHERRCIEFLAAYYQINCRQAELAAARVAGAGEVELHDRLAAVEAAIDAVNQLEDRYAPIGFYGEPAMNGDLYASIRFHRPEIPRIFPEASSLSSLLVIPGLDEIPKELLRGPMVVTRWCNGKMDL